MTLLSWLLAAANASSQPSLDFGAWVFVIAAPLSLLLFAVFGALVVRRRPANRAGWLFVGIGLVGAVSGLAGWYARYALVGGPAAGAEFAAWLANWPGQLILFLVFLLPLLFPQGRLPSPRWRPFVWSGTGGTALATLGVALTPGPLANFVEYVNPFGVSGELPGACLAIGRLFGFVFLPAVLLSLIRLGRARGEERQQVKWFVYGFAPFVVGYAAGLVLTIGSLESLAGVAFTLGNFGLVAIPTAIGIAILRYRLYDIDLLINRTLVYAATTAATAATFYAGLFALQAFLRPLTTGSELAVAASTLVSFALFQPIRRRVQNTVDRRFDRSRYDAARTLEAFADRLRDEVDLDALRSDLIGAVRETMAPAHASLWLRRRAR